MNRSHCLALALASVALLHAGCTSAGTPARVAPEPSTTPVPPPDGISKDQVLFELGEAVRKEKELEVAIKVFERIEPRSDYWERGRVQIGVCQFRSGRESEAFATFEEFLRVVSEGRPRTPSSPTRAAREREATATAEFYLGLILFMRAEHDRVVELLCDYHVKHGGNEHAALANWTLDMVMRSRLELGDGEGAREAMAIMTERFPATRRTSNSAVVLYRALGKERDRQIDPAAQRALEQEQVELLRARNRVDPSFASLRKESKHWMELGEFEEAERVLAGLEARFAQDEEYGVEVQRWVLPDLAIALRELGMTEEAEAALERAQR